MYKIRNKIRLIEFFAGVGSQAMALRDIGADFEHWLAVEFDKYPIASYNAIHGTNFPTLDITQIHGKDLRITDTDNYTYILTYSFPCQDLSVAGKGAGMSKGSGTRSGLLWEVERILNECDELPQVLLMENVPQVHGKKNVADFNQWLAFLESKGYHNFWKDLNAKDYGVAQNRNRCFCVSLLSDEGYVFPEPIPLTKCMADYLDDDVDESFYLTDRQCKRLTGNVFSQANSRLQDKEYCDTLLARDYKDPKVVCVGQMYPNSGNPQAGRIYNPIGVSPALDTCEGGNRMVKIDCGGRKRKLTPKEYFRLMGFSDSDFEKAAGVNSNTQLYKQAGNSIVMDVLMAIFSQMIDQPKGR